MIALVHRNRACRGLDPYWLHEDLSQALDDELEIFCPMESAKCLAELVGSIVRHWVGDEDQQELETTSNERLLGVFNWSS